MDWIAANQEALNLEYVIHTGDIVNIWDDFDQWEVADKAMKVLDDAGIPYGVLAGNHDVDQKDNNYTNYYTYFGDQRFEDRSILLVPIKITADTMTLFQSMEMILSLFTWDGVSIRMELTGSMMFWKSIQTIKRF